MERLLEVKEIALEIKRSRNTLGLTQKKLAFNAGVSQAALARIERTPKEYNPSYATIYKILEALNNETRKKQPTGIENKTVETIMHKKIVSIKPNNSFHQALELMKGKNFSQLPVIDQNKAVLGTIYQKQLADIILEGKNPKKILVNQIMQPALPQIDKKTQLNHIKAILEKWPAILITEKQKVIGIMTSYDWFKTM